MKTGVSNRKELKAMKRLFALLLTATLCFSLAACGGGSEDSSSELQQSTTLTRNPLSLLPSN